MEAPLVGQWGLIHGGDAERGVVAADTVAFAGWLTITGAPWTVTRTLSSSRSMFAVTADKSRNVRSVVVRLPRTRTPDDWSNASRNPKSRPLKCRATTTGLSPARSPAMFAGRRYGKDAKIKRKHVGLPAVVAMLWESTPLGVICPGIE